MAMVDSASKKHYRGTCGQESLFICERPEVIVFWRGKCWRARERKTWCLGDEMGLLLVRQAEIVWNMGFSWTIICSIHIFYTNLYMNITVWVIWTSSGWVDVQRENVRILSCIYRNTIWNTNIFGEQNTNIWLGGKLEDFLVCIEEIRSEVEKYTFRSA